LRFTDTKANETTSTFGLASVCAFCNGSRLLLERFNRFSEEDCRHRRTKGDHLKIPWCELSAKDPNPSADITKKPYEDIEKYFFQE